MEREIKYDVVCMDCDYRDEGYFYEFVACQSAESHMMKTGHVCKVVEFRGCELDEIELGSRFYHEKYGIVNFVRFGKKRRDCAVCRCWGGGLVMLRVDELVEV